MLTASVVGMRLCVENANTSWSSVNIHTDCNILYPCVNEESKKTLHSLTTIAHPPFLRFELAKVKPN